MRGAALIIAASMLISRVLGVAREILLARIAGIGPEKNALDLAFLIPDILNHVVSTGFLTIIFIPIFTGYMVKKEEDRAWKFFANILNTLGILMLVLVVPAWIWMREALLLFTTVNPEPEILDRAVHFARIVLPAQIAFLAGSFLVALQHTRKQFLYPALTGVIYNASIIVGGLLFADRGLEGFAWGVPAGAFVGFICVQIWGAYRGGIRWMPVMDFRDPDLRRYLGMMLPLVMGVGAMFTMEFVIRSFGSAFGSQGISALNYAYRVMYTLVAVFGFSVGVAGYPDMSRLAKEGNFAELNLRLMRSLDRMISILIPAIAAVWVLSLPIVRILFERGAFDAQATELVAQLLRWYLPASIGLCTQAVLVRYFYAQERMWIPTLVNTSLFLLSLPFYGLAESWFGIRSVPLVGTVVALLQVFALLIVRVRMGHYRVPVGVRFAFFPSVMSLLLVVALYLWIGESTLEFFQELNLVQTVLASTVLGVVVFLGTLAIQIPLGSLTARELLLERILRRK